MKIAVLFDGAGLARLGLEQAGHDCTGFEIDRRKWQLGLYVGSGHVELADSRDADLSKFDAVWSSPPCQNRSNANYESLVVGIRNHIHFVGIRNGMVNMMFVLVLLQQNIVVHRMIVEEPLVIMEDVIVQKIGVNLIGK